jgi:hypothetical protein
MSKVVQFDHDKLFLKDGEEIQLVNLLFAMKEYQKIHGCMLLSSLCRFWFGRTLVWKRFNSLV